MKRSRALIVWLSALAVFFFFPVAVHAYIGPGAGLSAIGTALAVLAAIVAAIFGFVWYPIKRLIRKFRSTESKENTDELK